jgi:hypothetical protein
MEFKEIKFEMHMSRYWHELALLLSGKYWVPKSDVLLAWNHFSKAGLPEDYRTQVDAQILFGEPEAVWKAMKVGKRIALGRCLKYFVDNGMLPLRLANPGKKGKKKYVRK